jgi:hypothetical protein
MTFIVLSVAALAAGIWVGLGHPGLPGREDRFVESGARRRLERRRLDWLRAPQRDRDRLRRR